MARIRGSQWDWSKPVVEMFEIFAWILDALVGWRYLLSSSFRKQTHQRWRVEGKAKAAIDIFFGGLSVAFTLLLLGTVVVLIMGY